LFAAFSSSSTTFFPIPNLLFYLFFISSHLISMTTEQATLDPPSPVMSADLMEDSDLQEEAVNPDSTIDSGSASLDLKPSVVGSSANTRASSQMSTRRPSHVGSTTQAASIRSAPGSKSKKKKTAPAPIAPPPTSAASCDKGAQGENTGRWTAEEHRLFLQGLEQHGKGWKKIASLIKSRTVVQIRTHAQKYFQKLAKARQNGEEGDVQMEGRGGVSSVASVSTAVAAQTSKRRRQATGTKRKAIQSVVASAHRQGKKLATAQGAAGVPNPVAPLPAISQALAHFVLPNASSSSANACNGPSTSCVPSISMSQGTISGPALEDSM
jgi:SHAQKYF class myb-like DNA-binding protein